MTVGLMGANDPLKIKRRFIRPMPPNPVIEKMNKRTGEYKVRIRRRFCLMCTNLATKELCYDYDGAILVERYCDDCIKKQNV